MVKFEVISTNDNFTITLAEVKSSKKLIIKYSDLKEKIEMVSVDSVYEEIRNRIKDKYDVEKSEIKLKLDNKTKYKIASIAQYNKDTFEAL